MITAICKSTRHEPASSERSMAVASSMLFSALHRARRARSGAKPMPWSIRNEAAQGSTAGVPVTVLALAAAAALADEAGRETWALLLMWPAGLQPPSLLSPASASISSPLLSSSTMRVRADAPAATVASAPAAAALREGLFRMSANVGWLGSRTPRDRLAAVAAVPSSAEERELSRFFLRGVGSLIFSNCPPQSRM